MEDSVQDQAVSEASEAAVSEAEGVVVSAEEAQVAAGKMKNTRLYLILFVFFALNINAQHTTDNSRIKLIFAGDIMGHDTQIAAAKTEKGYNYDTCFSLLKPYIESADIAIANLELTLAGPPYKGYPLFSSPDELASAIKKAGFDLLVTANNHSLDRRKEGLERTLDVLDSLDIIRTGTFKTSGQRDSGYPLIIEKNNIRLAILNYTYGTNGIQVQSPNIVNITDKTMIREDLEKASLAEPDFTLVTIHWGLEYQREENIQQQELAEFMVAHGADAIIGSHPHVVQPIKKIKAGEKEGLVVYSLGNFISNQRKRYTDGGILFEMVIEKNSETKIREYNYLPVWVYKAPADNGKKHFVLVPSIHDSSYYRSVFGMSKEDYQSLKLFNDDTVEHLKNVRRRDNKPEPGISSE
ncbi:MAG: CapA family protein [Bacteroidota bacterium]